MRGPDRAEERLEPQRTPGEVDGGDDEEPPSLRWDSRRVAETGLLVLIVVAAIYVLLPKIAGAEDALARLEEGDPAWIAIALGFALGSFAAYVALFRGVVGERALHLEWRESYQITMAGLAATRLFSAGGAGGIVLTYWALRKAGMRRKEAACRMVAFLILLYFIYMVALIVFGVLLRTGVLPGKSSVGLTIVPAGIAGAVVAVFLLMTLVPGDLERRLYELSSNPHRLSSRWLRRLATVPETLAKGTRTAIGFVRNPRAGGLAVTGAAGFWAANIGILWASFKAFDVEIPVAVLVQGFFIGMAANLIPFAPGGVGSVDAGMIGAFLLFGFPTESVFPAVLAYRLIAFWLPIPFGIAAYVGLRRTVERWDSEAARIPEPRLGSKEPKVTSESKV